MADRTVVQRVKNQRDARLLEGWQEVRVWVPSEKDAEDIRNIAADRRPRPKRSTDSARRFERELTDRSTHCPSHRRTRIGGL